MIQIVAVGRIKEKAMKQLIEEYAKRISAYSKIEIAEVEDEPNNSLPEETVKQIEGERILKQIKKDSYVILLDLQGKMIDSEKLAQKISEINTYHSSNISFVIGGSLG
ncbi:MAG: 23S rRNA (pseudouridine(1915)-N(3))-methyltransferase RlmH, partial [Erysipelotrichaceae bacterium]|nr:23S rRNA (pseudouridine(1915)-N(3))-methyltransferase RlmH [Erysipelotrichaceae bacterium]